MTFKLMSTFYFYKIREMCRRLKDSERQRMLFNYAKTGEVPEGFYVKEMADGRVQFRRRKQALTIDDYKAKIQMYQNKIDEFNKLISEFSSSQSENEDESDKD